jgi:two-component system sensor histidine kinase PhoQ
MSLNLRIIIGASIVLLVFISLTAAALNQAYVESSDTALRNQLTSQLYALMAATEVDDTGVHLPSSELDALLGVPSSGLYAYIIGQDKKTLWQSSSTLDSTPPSPIALGQGQRRLFTVSNKEGNYWIYVYGVNWSYDSGSREKHIELSFNIITDLAAYHEQVESFRSTLRNWLLTLAAILLIMQTIILRWGLKPLRKVSQELSMIEQGKQEKIISVYPKEIKRLTDSINQLISQERDRQTRYRNALGDLAHSLKTPLAVIHNHIASMRNRSSADNDIQDHVTRMNSIIEYQLQRAATAGSRTGKSINVMQTVDRIITSLKKVYSDKHIEFDVEIPQSAVINIDEGDFMELLGNLVDNACKWTNSEIKISYSKNAKHVLVIEDNGPGIASDVAETVMQRGSRIDSSTPGHGIGLSIVNNIVTAYHGSIEIQKVSPTGARIIVTI